MVMMMVMGMVMKMVMVMVMVISFPPSGRLRRVGRIEEDEVAVVKAQVCDHHHHHYHGDLNNQRVQIVPGSNGNADDVDGDSGKMDLTQEPSLLARLIGEETQARVTLRKFKQMTSEPLKS